MLKKISTLALVGMIALPVSASAGSMSTGAASPDLAERIEELSRELDELKARLAEQDETITGYDEKIDGMNEKVELLDDKSEAWDLAARFKFYGDFRARLDSYSATGPDFLNPFTGLLEGGHEYSNDSVLTNRFRLNMDVKATENVTFKGRLAMYKAWGMESYPRNDMNTWLPQFDGNSTRIPSDNALRVDRAFVNWANIGGRPVWVSIGRRPTTDGTPAQIRLGIDKQMATSTAYMDYPFDGLSLGYA